MAMLRRGLPIAVATLVAAGLASAAGGELDPSFSGDGWVRTLELKSGSEFRLTRGAEDVAVQPDGKLVVVGGMIDGNSASYFGAVRYLPDGSLDLSFAGRGWTALDLGSFERAYAVAAQRDGKIVVGGETLCPRAMCFALVRFTPDGTLDRSFGEGGVVRTMFATCGCAVTDLALQPDGRIVAAGWRNRGGDAQDSVLFALARYLPSGELDPSFSRDGRVSIDFGYGRDIAAAVALQRDGRIVVAGRSGATEDEFVVARLRPDGRLDRTFSADGKAAIDFGRTWSDGANGLALGRGGRILVAGGSGKRYSAPRVAVAELRSNGSLSWKRLLRPGPHGGYAEDVVQLRDGSVVAGGRAFEDDRLDASDWLLVRLGAGGGVVRSDFGTGADWVAELALQPDGKLVAAGSIYASHGVARYRLP
jgi:uncharacterized delta-60 repeat protein